MTDANGSIQTFEYPIISYDWDLAEVPEEIYQMRERLSQKLSDCMFARSMCQLRMKNRDLAVAFSAEAKDLLPWESNAASLQLVMMEMQLSNAIGEGMKKGF